MKHSEVLYHKILNIVVDGFHNEITDSIQLNKLAKKYLPEFQGVYASDRIPCKHGYYIINLDRSDEPGSHWCGLIRGKTNYVYDSFGRVDILPIKAVYTERDEEQLHAEDNCGQRCVAWLILAKHWGVKAALEI